RRNAELAAQAEKTGEGRRGNAGLERLKHHDRADRFARLHQVEAFVDALERQVVGDQVVDIDLVFHVPVDDLRHVGTAARAAEGRTLPDPAGDQLERTGGDFLARFGHADDDRLAPALVAALQR